MPKRSPFRAEVRVEPAGTPVSPQMRLGTLADRRARYEVDLLPAGEIDRLDIEVEGSRWKLSLPADVQAELSFRRRRGEPVVRLRAELALEVALRGPARRGPGEVFAGRLSAGGRAELTVDLPGADSWTLARAAREAARRIDPRPWAGRGRPEPGSIWRLTGELPLELAASARVRGVVSGPLAGLSTIAPLPAVAELEARLARTDRVQAELRVLEDGDLRARLSSLARRRRALAGSAELGWELTSPDALGRALLRAVGPDVAEAARDLHRLLGDVREVQRALEELPEDVRALGGRAVGPGSRLERLELRLAEIEALVDALDGDDERRGVQEAVRWLRERVASLRERGAAWVERVASLAEELDPADRLPRFAAGLARVVERLSDLEQELVGAAGSVLAEGLTVDLSASHRRTSERQRLVEARLAPGASRSRSRAVALVVTGRLPALARLEGEPGIRRVSGRMITAAKRRRRRAVRLRLGVLGVDRSAVWQGELRVSRSLDGAVEVRARERLERERRRLAHEDVASLLVDLVLAGELGDLDPSLTLRWSQSWRGRRTRQRATAMLERTIVALELALEPGALPERPGELQVRSRLDAEAIAAALRPSMPAARFAETAFWPAWASAIESGYRRVPPPDLRPGRHPLRSPQVRRALRREPFARTVGEVLVGLARLEREAVAADWRVGRALLDALEAVRRAARAPEPLSPRVLSRLGRDVVGALRHAGAIDLVPLIALTALVPPPLRRVDLRVEPG
jgi:hypothetical protein